MALVSMRELLDHAAENGYGIPAFNVNNLEQVQAVMQAADEVGAPVILQASAGARKYAGEPFIKHLIQAAAEQWPHIPLVMHQDHGTSPKVCQGALDLGFGSVMMDGSLMEDGKTPSSFDYNVNVTRTVVEMAHKVGATVEGELGCLGNLETGDAGEEDGIGAVGKLDHSQMLTDPEEAAVFVKATQLDALAIAIGTSHGAYKFTRKPDGDVLAMKRIEEIHAKLPNCHLVMHGSSSVPQELQDIIGQLATDLAATKRWRLQLVGDRASLPAGLESSIAKAEKSTGKIDGLHVNLAVGYGGRKEIADAMRSILRQHAQEGTTIDELAELLDPDLITQHLYTSGQPDPDLVIRTSGEQRLSGFLLSYFLTLLSPLNQSAHEAPCNFM